jgi:7-cyano-7-deazaguanine synthase in queuosine biosynthesis
MINEMQSALNLQVSVGEDDCRDGWQICRIGKEIDFEIDLLNTYFYSEWSDHLYDLMVVTAAVEYADRLLRRRQHVQSRRFTLSIPVHNADRWNVEKVKSTLVEALSFLTADVWEFEFLPRKYPVARPIQNTLPLDNTDGVAVLAFSNGMDSLAASFLASKSLGGKLVRIRVGPYSDLRSKGQFRSAFAAIPYNVKEVERKFRETSARSRGFKFAVISAIAAFLGGIDKIVVPESGQGSLGPAIFTSGQAHPDFRNHPAFTKKMERFIDAVLGSRVSYIFPMIWNTKAETLRAYIEGSEDDNTWRDTRSCWQNNRHVSVERSLRQCGICAACMLRRVSVFGASKVEDATKYVWENLSANSFEGGASPQFERKKITRALKEYALAGALHMEDMANISTSNLRRTTSSLAPVFNMQEKDIEKRVTRLFKQHADDWTAFKGGLRSDSFLFDWIDS